MNISFKLSKKQAQALLFIASKDEVRPALCGAALLRGKGGLWFIGASDGYVALIERIDVEEDGCEDDIVFVPRDVLELVAKGANGEVQILDDTIRVDKYAVDRVLYVYPDLRSICPKEISFKYARFDADKLARVQKALRLWNDEGHTFYYLLYNGPSSVAVVPDGDKGCALVMSLDGEKENAVAGYNGFLASL